MIKATLNYGKQIDKIALLDIIQPLKEVIQKEYESLAIDQKKIRIIKESLSLIKEVNLYLDGNQIQTSRQASINFMLNTASGPKIKLLFENNTTVVKSKTFQLEVSEFLTLKDLKTEVLNFFSVFSQSDIFLMSKGRILYELNKSLKEISIEEGQKILIFQNEDMENEAEEVMINQKKSKIKKVQEVLPNLEEHIISFVMTRTGDDVMNTISMLASADIEAIEKEYLLIRGNVEIGGSSNKDGGNENQKLLKKLKEDISEQNDLYNLLFKLLRLKEPDLWNQTWEVLEALPFNSKINKIIKEAVFKESYLINDSDDMMNWSFNAYEISEKPGLSKNIYLTYSLLEVLKSGLNPDAVEWLLFEGNLGEFLKIFENPTILTALDDFNSSSSHPIENITVTLRTFRPLILLIKWLNEQFKRIPCMKTMISRETDISSELLKEVEKRNNGKEYRGSINFEIEGYSEIYHQALQESKFLDNLLELIVSMLKNHFFYDPNCYDLFYELILDSTEILINSGPNDGSVIKLILKSFAELVLGGAHSLTTLFSNVVSYYTLLFDKEIDMTSWLLQELQISQKSFHQSEVLKIKLLFDMSKYI